ncbi:MULTISPECIES: CidA/LrgA family protein [Mammaliicoccus]|uniref:CidA/LrgA family protein n=1 Tax=Mammaliicoccus vitulinus TaxID=71237 RepID=A0A2T4PWL7_9STAP|nr:MULTISPECIES: CidA/LrgA family protein [Mammaliicoccus]HAL09636.1 CidA/LrgA family protein [Staphylococcus sp.]MBO3078120.1 CidA/LrgA family protein [Mammaliicoccus vitulinus]MEB7657492.1 CidA/LrgA family protein [Mammaliicoccus vitulinus]PTI30879.1 CidA/LrgA family protein [Mammaliicoccus vitulinus]PTI38583.1 CidA/LrgA family protein [Mammaliicoccus vitulinus]
MMKLFIKILFQVSLIYVITQIGKWLQEILHIPIAGSIVGLAFLFFLLLTGILPEHWIEVGANKLINVMILFFVPSIVGVMDIADQIGPSYIIMVVLLIITTSLVALSSGYVCEKILNINKANKENAS